MTRTSTPRDAHGRLHGDVVFVWNERRGPAVGGGTSAWGERSAGRPVHHRAVRVMLGSTFHHGQCGDLWTWIEIAEDRQQSWQGKVRIEPLVGDPLVVTPIGVWNSLLKHGDCCEPMSPWKLKNRYPKKDTMDDLITQARQHATTAHHGQLRKGAVAKPYIDHPGRVAERVRSWGMSAEVVAAAWLHDVLEDTDANLEAFPQRIQDLVDLLTRHKTQESKDDALDRLAASGDADAITIKVADRLDNLSEGMASLDDDWLRKYLKTSHRILAIGQSVSAKGCDDLAAFIKKAEDRLSDSGVDQ